VRPQHAEAQAVDGAGGDPPAADLGDPLAQLAGCADAKGNSQNCVGWRARRNLVSD